MYTVSGPLDHTVRMEEDDEQNLNWLQGIQRAVKEDHNEVFEEYDTSANEGRKKQGLSELHTVRAWYGEKNSRG